MRVYVATVETRYPSVAVAETADEAVRLACSHALAFLKEANATVPGQTDTVEGVADYFSVFAYEIEMNSAKFERG